MAKYKYIQTIQNPTEFLNDFILQIDKAQHNIYIQSMNFETGKVMSRLQEKLNNAVKRGVEIRITYDWVAQKFVHGELPILPVMKKDRRGYIKNLHQKNIHMYEQFTTSGMKLVMINKPSFPYSILPFVGRNHRKIYIIDNKVCWIGGVNLFDDAFENIDLMVKVNNRKIITTLRSSVNTINKHTGLSDYSISCGRYETLYLDGGRKGSSIIYKRAIKLIKESKKDIIFMSQFLPDYKILNELVLASKRNIQVTIITSPEAKKHLLNIKKLFDLYNISIIKNCSNIKLVRLSKFVHAKLLLVDDNIAFFGSHNLSYTGVLFGTEELMLETKRLDTIKQLKHFVSTELENNEKRS